jgi:hypothetical protein
MTTKLKELKADWDAAEDALDAAWEDADAAAYRAADAAAAYFAELKKQENSDDH